MHRHLCHEKAPLPCKGTSAVQTHPCLHLPHARVACAHTEVERLCKGGPPQVREQGRQELSIKPPLSLYDNLPLTKCVLRVFA